MSSFSRLLVCLLLAASGKASGGSTSTSSSAGVAAAAATGGGERSATSGQNMSLQSAARPGTGGASGARAGTKSPSPGTSASSTMSSPPSTDVPLETGPPPSYAKDVAPLFELRCVKCHGSPFARNDLRLTSYANVMRGGETGTAVVPGDAEGSLLLKKVEARDKPAMPPRKPLTKPEKELLRRWIAAGAPP